MIYDIAIIGAGPGGANAAEYAKLNGLSVVLFEKGAGGGVCLNEGCIPSKTYLHTAHLYKTLQNIEEHALTCENVKPSMKALQNRKQRFVHDFGSGIDEGFQDLGIEYVQSYASILEKTRENTFIVTAHENGQTYMAKHLLLATGSKNSVPPFKGLDTCDYLTNKEILMLDTLPVSINILGGGTIAVEMASFFADMDVEVNMIQRSAHILKDMDRDLSIAVEEELRNSGVNLFTETQIDHINGHTIYFHHDGVLKSVSAETTLMALGRKPNLNNIGIEKLGIETEKDAIKVNQYMETNIEGVYACGDIIGKSLLAHTARREGQVAINHILKIEDTMRYNSIPSVVYSSPEASGVGITEDEAIKKGIDYEVHKVPMSYAGRHIIEYGHSKGFCKVIVSKRDHKILGGHILGCLSSEYITPLAMAVDLELTLERLSHIAFPHPSMAELVHHAIFPAKVLK